MMRAIRHAPAAADHTAQRFSRHKDVRTLEKYDDNRTDLAGDLARRLADDAG